ncbi:hypothetical protein DA103_22350 [Enterobacter cloacae]|uniref:Uncharacterized protein n=1 Tax=Enterobacter cloacae TaxID=550 RepID=A0A2T4XUL1_ENTCL|nr:MULTISPECIES: peptide IlvX [Enterobacter]MBO4148994.1 peptide IlvX [Enterobacter ludwigii]MCG3102005.1 peptide IlvX [Enterobacter sp. DRP3]HDT2078076.1 hypothetical protein [Enterobacter roggenkampii]HEG2004329.1 hypothetical protein [Enterobacter asburiae]MBM1023912.1 peptide IlvX [Enterobacter sp. E1]
MNTSTKFCFSRFMTGN